LDRSWYGKTQLATTWQRRYRGYLLDRELSDRELHFWDFNVYVSKYRRVLEMFDAVKIGLRVGGGSG